MTPAGLRKSTTTLATNREAKSRQARTEMAISKEVFNGNS